jgi:hypothetical protein
MNMLSNSITRKFTSVVEVSDWSVHTDSGWQPLTDVKQTIAYEVWELILDNGMILHCADTHIVFDEYLNEIFVKDILPGQLIATDTGLSAAVSVTNLCYDQHMYDMAVDSVDHRYYTNGILSHNTTTAAGYLLWYAMFVPDSTILVAAHKHTGASEIMSRVRYSYESCPDHIRCGATAYNKQSIEFDNGSRIVAQTTTETTGRGMSLSLLYCLDGDTTVTVRDKSTLIEETISLVDLYTRMYSSTQIIE